MTPTGALYHHARTRPKTVAFIRDKEIWTYERLATEVDRLARGLIEHGVRNGDRVALHMANLPELVVAYHACFRVGAIAAPLNIRFKTAELGPLLQRLRPALYIGQADLYSQVASIDSKTAESYEHWDLDGDQITTLFCPMVHASGLFTMFACIRFGVPFVLHERFDPGAIFDAIERHHCTWVIGLPFMFAALLHQQRARA